MIKSINLYCYQCCVTFGNQSWLLLFSVTFDLLWLYLKGICPLFKMVIQNVLGFFFPDFFSTNSQVHSSKFSFNMYCCLIFCCFFLLLQTLISYVVYNYYNMSVFTDSNEVFFFANCDIFIFSENSDFNYQYFLLNCLGFLVGKKTWLSVLFCLQQLGLNIQT